MWSNLIVFASPHSCGLPARTAFEHSVASALAGHWSSTTTSAWVFLANRVCALTGRLRDFRHMSGYNGALVVPRP
ncbi:hypothetical protein BDV93DRAFT_528277 [Ceratobasidium sp. AG-I]|nr:hypothetical protein BDV93DRAFT_528277 [Ceratobasidium sp. AG-I]